MSEKRKYDSTVARIAGNLLSGVMASIGSEGGYKVPGYAVDFAVKTARAIVAEVERTEPVKDEA